MQWKPHILFEDNHILVVEKPSGLLSQSDHTGDPDIFSLLKEYLKVKYQKPGNVYLGLIQRLDRPVSGIMVFAKTSKAAERLQKMMKNGEVIKKYLAICEGFPEKDQALLENYLTKDEQKNKTKVYDAPRLGAKLCRLSYRLLSNQHGRSLLQLELHTGRSHQIRAQLAHIGCPIFGDRKYGKLNTGLESDLALHAYYVELIHPVSKEEMSWVCWPSNKSIWKEFAAFFPKKP